MLQDPAKKRCTTCKKWKPETIEFFYLNKSGKGFKARCRKCNYKIVQKWRKENPDKYRAMSTACTRAWRKKNPDAYRILHKRTKYKARARRHALPTTLTLAEWRETLRYFDHRCAYCWRRRKLEQEHLIPLCQGGPYTKDNIVPACATCNNKKAGRTPAEAGMQLRKPWPLTSPSRRARSQSPDQSRSSAICYMHPPSHQPYRAGGR